MPPLTPDALLQMMQMGFQQPQQAGMPSQDAVAPQPQQTPTQQPQMKPARQPVTKDFASDRNPKLLKALGPRQPRFTARKRHPAMGG